MSGPAWAQLQPAPDRTAASARPADTEPAPAPEAGEAGTRLVAAAGVSGTLATALESTLQRFRLPDNADEADEERELRRAERAASETLATEGYFSPRLRFELGEAAADRKPRYRLLVETGPLTRVGAVRIEFRGALADPAFAARAANLRNDWLLPVGSAFRSAEWETAKARLVQAASARDFAAALIVGSHADVDAEAATAALQDRAGQRPPPTASAN